MAKKSEARIARQIEKQLKDAEKSVRLRTSIAPSAPAPRAGANPGSIYQMMMTWTDVDSDKSGHWSWGHARDWGQPAWDGIISPKLAQWQQLLWREIEALTTDSGHRMHHEMPTESICDEAQVRLMEIGHYVDNVFRFRLANMRRLWGYRIVNRFHIVWYDPQHNIYPVDPD
jgi:hypothetical protein